jgi:hypothetical protein
MRSLPAVLALFLGGCNDAIWVSEGGTFQVQASQLDPGNNYPLDPVRRVLTGSTTPLTVRAEDCSETRFVGSISPLYDDVVEFSPPGTAVIEVVPTDCAPPEAVADRLTLEVVPPTLLSGAVVENEGAVFGGLQDGGLTWVTDPEPRVFEGLNEDISLPAEEVVKLQVRLLADGEPVAVGPGAGQLEVTGAVASAPISPLGSEVWTGEGFGEVHFRGTGFADRLFNWRAVHPRHLRRLRILAVWSQADGFAGVQPWIEDREGRRVVGVPVRWEVESRHHPKVPDPMVGGFVLEPTPCLRPSQRGGVERVKITARAAGLRDSIEFDVSVPFAEGTPEELADMDAAFLEETEELCAGVPTERRPCGCSSAGFPSAGWLGGMAVLMVAGLRRVGVRQRSAAA